MLNIILFAAVTATCHVTANIVDICSFTQCDKSTTLTTIPVHKPVGKTPKETIINYE